MFLSESSRGVSDGSVHAFGIVIGYLSVNSKYEMFSCFILFHISEFELEFSVVGFLRSILPRRSLGTHRDENMFHLKKLHHGFARIFRSLITVEVFWYDSPSFSYGILNSCKDKFFCVGVAQCISYNLFRKVIKNSGEIEMNSPIDDMCKITSPYHIGMERTE